MPEQQNGKNIYSLLEVTQSIQKLFAKNYTSSYWIKAEMSKLGFYAQSGHCFPELVEKNDGKVIAKIDSLIWKNDYIKINTNFKRVLNEPLKDGIKILFLASVEYSPEYGLKLRITDIDPSFTLGDFEREKQETIQKLQAEGIFNKNKLIEFPILPKRIAIISDKDSRGYQDFINVFEAAKKSWNYNFFHMLFPAALQGDKAIATIPLQLSRINKIKHHFDVVAIIRGGGGELSFACYNNFELSKAIATFSIPVVTGIGHVTNLTVVDMIASQSSITPTKLAEFFIQKFHNFSVPVKEAEKKVIDKSRRLIVDEKTKFQSEVKLFRSVTTNILLQSKNNIKEQANTLIQQSHFIITKEKEYVTSLKVSMEIESIKFVNSVKDQIKQIALGIKKDVIAQLKQIGFKVNQNVQQLTQASKSIFKTNAITLMNIEDKVGYLSPKEVLKRGYSITMINGKAIRSSSEINKEEILNTILFDGSIISTVNSTSKSTEQ